MSNKSSGSGFFSFCSKVRNTVDNVLFPKFLRVSDWKKDKALSVAKFVGIGAWNLAIVTTAPYLWAGVYGAKLLAEKCMKEYAKIKNPSVNLSQDYIDRFLKKPLSDERLKELQGIGSNKSVPPRSASASISRAKDQYNR